MTLLILGLLIFLGVHSVRIVAEPWRTQMRARLGDNGWKGLYSLLSIAGFVMIVWGYGLARQQPVALWEPMTWARHLASLLTLVAFVLLVAAYVPGNGIKSRLRHPMVLGVKTWALAHLLANHTLADLLLFGGFLVWAALSYRAARQRDRAAGAVGTGGSLVASVITVAVGVVAWAGFAMWAHRAWIGVPPF
ncbi:MAG: NnrU family protein [Burkholderiaceae bacterium]|nr:NnrU family protein [Burkholderiaceae bacterium]